MGNSLSLVKFAVVFVLLANCLGFVSDLSAGEPNQRRLQRTRRVAIRAQSPSAGTAAEELPVAESVYDVDQTSGAETVYYTEGYEYVKERGSIALFLSRTRHRMHKSLSRTERVWSYAHRGIYDVLAKKERKHRKSFFLHTQRYHKQLLNPVCSPVCTSNFGYHKTCWRQFPDICDPCPPAVPAAEPYPAEAIPPVPEVQPQTDVSSASEQQNQGNGNLPVTDFQWLPTRSATLPDAPTDPSF